MTKKVARGASGGMLPGDLDSVAACLAEVRQLRAMVNDVAAGRLKCVWGWDGTKDKMGYWFLNQTSSRHEGTSHDTPLEALEAAALLASQQQGEAMTTQKYIDTIETEIERLRAENAAKDTLIVALRERGDAWKILWMRKPYQDIRMDWGEVERLLVAAQAADAKVDG